MEIKFASVSAYDKNHHIITIKADENETIRNGQIISIELQDETFVECKISAMRKWKQNDKRGKWIDVDFISDGETGEIDVYGELGNIQTSGMPSAAERRRLAEMVNLMPYKELCGGTESIYENIDANFVVPPKVILYLQTTQPHMVAMGMYKHPFKDMTLPGPYWYTDGEYYWDRDAWKYVLKYHVKLPESFINKVMSEAGTAFLEKCEKSDKSWSKRINEFKKNPNMLCLMPNDAGDVPLDEF